MSDIYVENPCWILTLLASVYEGSNCCKWPNPDDINRTEHHLCVFGPTRQDLVPLSIHYRLFCSIRIRDALSNGAAYFIHQDDMQLNPLYCCVTKGRYLCFRYYTYASLHREQFRSSTWGRFMHQGNISRVRRFAA